MPDLTSVQHALCAIGDSSYDTFCQGPEKIIDLLLQCGSTPIVDKIQIDVQQDPVPEEPALAWLSQWQQKINQA
jgi:MioC protein